MAERRMLWVRYTKPVYKQHKFTVGETVQLEELSAFHWVKRGVAELIDAAPDAKPTTVSTEVHAAENAMSNPDFARRGPGRPRKVEG